MRCALVGYGWWGRTVAYRCRASESISISMVVDPSESSRQAALDAGYVVETLLENALYNPRIDAVILTTPHSMHEAQVIASAEAGKHVFCEKPLGLTLASAARSIDACRSARVTLGIGHERRFEPAMQKLKGLVSDGELGTVLHAEADFSHDKLVGLDGGNWRRSSAECPAGGMTGGGIHLTDLLIAMFGNVEVVSALTTRSVLKWETGITAQLGFANGMTASVASLLATPHYVRFRVFGTKAWAEVTNRVHPDAVDGKTLLTVFTSNGEESSIEFDYTDTILANLNTFAFAVSGKEPYPISAHDILHNTEVFEAIARAAQEQCSVRLPLSGAEYPRRQGGVDTVNS